MAATRTTDKSQSNVRSKLYFLGTLISMGNAQAEKALEVKSLGYSIIDVLVVPPAYWGAFTMYGIEVLGIGLWEGGGASLPVAVGGFFPRRGKVPPPTVVEPLSLVLALSLDMPPQQTAVFVGAWAYLLCPGVSLSVPNCVVALVAEDVRLALSSAPLSCSTDTGRYSACLLVLRVRIAKMSDCPRV